MNKITTLSLLKKQMEKYEDKIFAYFPDDQTKISYRELYYDSISFSQFFLNKGIRKGTHVSLIFKTGKDFILSFIALLNIGAIVYPVDWKMVELDASRNILNFESDFIIYHKDFEHYVSNIIKFLNNEKIGFFSLEVEKIKNNCKELDIRLSKENPALCIFTSGTTGDPKGVLLSHENIIYGASNLEKSHNLDKNDRVLACTPLTGINGNIFTLWTPILTGGSVIYYQGMFNSYNAFKIMEQYDVTWFNGIPTHYTIMVKIPVKITNFNLNKLRFMRSASAPLSPTIQMKFEDIYGIPIIETMGLTEMTGQVCSNPMEPERRKIGSVGLPVNTKVKIIDDNNNDVGINKTGELLIKGKALMIGYYNDKKATKKAVKNGWLYTGDIGYIDEDGFVFIKGRKKDIVIVGGKNVSMREIEDVLLSNESIQGVACFGIPDEISGERIVAFIKKNKNNKITREEINDFCHKNLSDYKCPKDIQFCDEFPRGGQGKILKSNLRAIYMEEFKND